MNFSFAEVDLDFLLYCCTSESFLCHACASVLSIRYSSYLALALKR